MTILAILTNIVNIGQPEPYEEVMKKKTKYSATDAKNHFGEVLKSSQWEVVIIEMIGCVSAVIISMEKFKELTAMEDSFWALKASQAKSEGFIGKKASEKLLEDLLNVED